MKNNFKQELIDKALINILSLQDSKEVEDYIKSAGEIIRFGRSYSSFNILLVLAQKRGAIWTEGFRTWKSKGRHPKKGTGIQIFAPVFKKKEDYVEEIAEDIEEYDFFGEEEEVPMELCGFKVVTVFDYTDTTGEKIPEIEEMLKKRDDFKKNLYGIFNQKADIFADVLLEYIQSKGIEIIRQDEGEAGGSAVKGRYIFVDKSFEKGEDFRVLLHEFAHCVLHFDDEGKMKKIDNLTAELEAELTSGLVLSTIGMDITNSAAYIFNWLKGSKIKQEKQKDLILKAFKKANNIAKEILHRFVSSPQLDFDF